MNKAKFACLSLVLLPTLIAAQGKKPWQEWNAKEVDKVLNNSPWGQTQTDTDTSEMVYSPTSVGRSSIAAPSTGRTGDQQSINNNRADRGATNQAVSINYRIRLLSAKPIRQALARMVILQGKPDPGLREQLSSFVDRDFNQFIVVAIAFDSTDGRFSGPALQAFASATAGTLKNNTFLERKDGKRLFLIDYKPPINDGLGAKFIFPRMVDGQPFLTPDSDNLRFSSQVSDKINLNMRYKLNDMTYDGKLEY
jgi:hypothetical protein